MDALARVCCPDGGCGGAVAAHGQPTHEATCEAVRAATLHWLLPALLDAVLTAPVGEAAAAVKAVVGSAVPLLAALCASGESVAGAVMERCKRACGIAALLWAVSHIPGGRAPPRDPSDAIIV